MTHSRLHSQSVGEVALKARLRRLWLGSFLVLWFAHPLGKLLHIPGLDVPVYKARRLVLNLGCALESLERLYHGPGPHLGIQID